MLLYVFNSVSLEMEFRKQPINIPIRNLDEIVSSDKCRERKHSELLPNSIRALIVGPSGSGKTNLMISLLESENGLKYENVYLYAKTLEQDKYLYLKKMLKPIKGLGFFTFSSSEKVIPPNLAKPNSIFIFDDIIMDRNQENVGSYFCLGRHSAICCFFLAQSYCLIQKHKIRDNANMIILFRQDNINLKHVFDEFQVGCDLSFQEFVKFCHKCWQQKFGFVVIDMESDVNKGRYRNGFDKFLQIKRNVHD